MKANDLFTKFSPALVAQMLDWFERYVKNAKPEVVEETRTRLAQAEADLDAARGSLDALGG